MDIMDIYDGSGNIVVVQGNNYPVINTDAYNNNFSNLFVEKFKTTNTDIDYSDCTPTSNGLSCTGFCKATYKKGTVLNDEKSSITFVYSDDIVIGVFITETLAYLNTETKVLGIAFGYMQNSTLSQSTTPNVEFNFVSGHEYELTVERNFWDVTATIKDISGSAEETVTGKQYIGNSANIVGGNLAPTGMVVFSGSCLVTGMSYWIPFADGKHLKAFIVGDSLTEGIASATTDETCWSRRLMFEHFHSNAMACGVGGTSPSSGINRFNALTNLGYSFDYVIAYLCTNDTCNNNQIQAKIQSYQGYVDTILATGAKCIWCMLPEYVGGSSSTDRANLRTVMSSLTGLTALIDFGKVLATSENTHPSLTGYTNMFKLADTVLEMNGI